MAESKAKRETERRTEAARRKVDKVVAAGDPDLERLDVEISFVERKVARLLAKEKRVVVDLDTTRENLGMLRRVRARAEGGK